MTEIKIVVVDQYVYINHNEQEGRRYTLGKDAKDITEALELYKKEDCLDQAYKVIEHRKGKIENGMFVKEE